MYKSIDDADFAKWLVKDLKTGKYIARCIAADDTKNYVSVYVRMGGGTLVSLSKEALECFYGMDASDDVLPAIGIRGHMLCMQLTREIELVQNEEGNCKYIDHDNEIFLA